MKIAIIGGGPAGYVSALTAKRAGAEVTLIEKDELGGTCLNRGCIPTKTIIHSLEILDKFRSQKYNSAQENSKITVELPILMQKKDQVVQTQRKGLELLLKQSGVRIIKDTSKLIEPKTILLQRNSEKIIADKVIIATGSKPLELPGLRFDRKKILSSDDLWNMKEIPQNILIVGAGAIGCEFAWIFNLLGSKVTLIELMPRVLPMEDGEISKAIERALKKRKIDIYTGVKIIDLKENEKDIEVTLSNGKIISTDIILVSVGRAFNSDLLQNTEIKLGTRGEVLVNEKMQTNVENVYAVGDINGKWLLAHVAYKEGEIAAKNATGENLKMDYSVIPSTIFTVLEVASVGLREEEAIQEGIKITKGIFPFRALGKAHAIGEIDGFVKVIADSYSDTIIGAHIAGPKASEIIHELALAVKLKIKARELKDLIHSHPTLSECISEAVADIHGEAIHKLDR